MTAEQPKRSVLLALDDNEASGKAYEWALKHFIRAGDDVHFFRVLPLPTPIYLPESDLYGAAEMDPDLIRAQMSQAAKKLQETCVPKLPSGTTPQVEVVQSEGDADTVGKLLCDRASQLQAAAIVMGSEHKGAMARFFVGSASLFCVKNCSRPCIIVE